MSQENRCPLCDGTVVLESRALEVVVGRRTVDVIAVVRVCNSCDEVLLEPTQMAALQQQAAEAVRTEESLLTPVEIRALRREHGLTQEQFEKLLGVGPKTVTRWEKGTVFHHGATNTLLRLLQRSPDCVRTLAELNNVQLGVVPMQSASPSVSYRYSTMHTISFHGVHRQHLLNSGEEVAA